MPTDWVIRTAIAMISIPGIIWGWRCLVMDFRGYCLAFDKHDGPRAADDTIKINREMFREVWTTAAGPLVEEPGAIVLRLILEKELFGEQ